MKRVQTLLAAAVLATCCHVQTARATLLTNGDFSSGSQGWETTGSTMVTDFSGVSSSYGGRWDLAPWQSTMNGSFMLLQDAPTALTARINPAGTFSSLVLSLSYAVAWDATKPLSSTDYGYFYVQVFGRGGDGINRPFSYNEIDWGPITGNSKGVLTGNLSTSEIFNTEGRFYNELLVSINVFNPNQTLTQIVGFDGVSLSVAGLPDPGTPGGPGTPPGGVPAPEPSSVLLLGLALAGTAVAAGKKKRTVRGI